jgi:hypothetical protein
LEAKRDVSLSERSFVPFPPCFFSMTPLVSELEEKRSEAKRNVSLL